MSIMKLALPVLCIIWILGLCMASASAAPPEASPYDGSTTGESTSTLPACAVTKEVTLGDKVTLTGPTPPDGVKYDYLWTLSYGSETEILGKSVSVDFTVEADPAKAPDYYVATLLVSAETETSGKLAGCVLTSCVRINVNKPDACALTGPVSVCQTKTDSVFEYKGSLDPIKVKKVAYLKWIVDETTEKDKDDTGKCSVDWTKHWDSSKASGAQSHKVTVELHSAKQGNLLSSCSMDVTVIPLPLTTITPG